MHTTEFQYIKTTQNSHIFLAHYLPVGKQADPEKNRAVVLVPPFAEEMNRSKRMYVLCARLLADSGIHAICFDYSGTGDSSGKWGDFEYQDWVGDVSDVYTYSTKHASEVNFIALRFGALVLADAILQSEITAKKCLLWDPVEKGDALTRPLVRMKIAAAMADNSKKITTQEVMDAMSNTGYIESAGYHITHSMFDEVNGKKLSDNISSIMEAMDVHWMTSGKFKQTENQWLANSLQQSDLELSKLNNLHMHAVNDVKFWMQQEVTISPQLLKLTREVFVGG